eukprot:jgi/Astpho2/3529/Aster-06442
MVHDCDNVQGNKIMTPQALLQSKDSVHSPCVSCKKISISLRNRGKACWVPAPQNLELQMSDLKMLYLRYAVGGQAELSAADTLSLDDTASGQEGGPTIKVNIARVVHEYLTDAMREVKIDEASIAKVALLTCQGQAS